LPPPLTLSLSLFIPLHLPESFFHPLSQYVHEIANSGKQLLSIVNDLLLYLQLEQGKVVLEPRKISVFMCLDDVVNVIFDEAERKGLRVITHYDLSLTDPVFGDPARVGQILLNLASNALKFTSTGTIELSVVRCADSIGAGEAKFTFAIKDTGVGIPKDKLAVISTPFTQVDEYSFSFLFFSFLFLFFFPLFSSSLIPPLL